jgi:hypothetical protein
VHPQAPHASCEHGVVGDQGAAVADPAQVLGRVEGVRGGHAAGAGEQRTVGLGRVLDDGELCSRHLGGTTEEVHDDRRPRPLCPRRVPPVGRHEGRAGIDVDRDRDRTRGADGGGGRRGGERGHQDLVARPDAGCRQRQLEGARPRRERDRVGVAAPRGQLGLEGVLLGAEQEPSGGEHPVDCHAVVIGQQASPAAQVDDRYHGCRR